jgi:hypothetical protein
MYVDTLPDRALLFKWEWHIDKGTLGHDGTLRRSARGREKWTKPPFGAVIDENAYFGARHGGH